MADCGATGSALDRATRVVLGVGNPYNGLSAILTSRAVTAGTTLPAAPPEYLPPLVLSSHSSCSAASSSPYTNIHHQSMESMINIRNSQMPAVEMPMQAITAPTDTAGMYRQDFPSRTSLQPQQLQPQYHPQQQLQHHISPMMMNMATGPTLSEAMSPQRMLLQMHQQQAWMGMMLQQQQQHHMKQQQQQQEQQQQQQQQERSGTADSSTLEQFDHEIGVEGSAQHASLQELAEAWKEATATTTTTTTTTRVDDDNVAPARTGQEPASIEELSEAWWEANQDWKSVIADELGGFYGLDEVGNPEMYEFRNKILPTTTTATTTTTSTIDYMEVGMRHFQAGEIVEAIRAFEMELQQPQTHDSSSRNGGGGDDGKTHAQFAKAWWMLGRCHAEQDMDTDAILCLEQAVEVDPYNVAARLELGVSYVNELRYDRALEQLKAWVTHNPQLLSNDVSSSSSSSSSFIDDIYGTQENTLVHGPFDEVQRLLLGALSSTTESQTLADIYTALGVVYNVSRDYDAAIDSFQRAISYSLDNDNNKYQLFNKLGATLANHDQSERALSYYQQALEIKPKYARAWLNRAISYANLQQYEQAATCYLHTLTLNPSALHCWSYLRTAIACCAEQDDLMPLVTGRNLEALRRHFGLDRLERTNN